MRLPSLFLIILLLLTAACSNPVTSLLAGSGPKVAANVQAGQKNTQTVGVSKSSEQKITRPTARTIRQTADNNKVSTETVETIVVNEIPPWLVGLFLLLFVAWSYLLWKLPSPEEIWRKKR